MASKGTVLNFLKKNELCVLATSNKSSKPEAAVMSCVAKSDFSILLFTDTESRKYKNIRENSQISAVIGGFKGDPTVQIDGTIRELVGNGKDATKKYILSSHPDWKDYFSASTRFLEVTPTWLRYSDFSKQTPEIQEFNDLA